MSEAILATFADFKTIRTRSTVQLILEIPIEQADEALKALGGVPQPGTERWVGVALAPKERNKMAGQTDPQKVAAESIAAGPAKHRPFNSLPLSQQAGIRCNDKQFQEYICHEFWNTQVSEPDEPYTTHLVKEHLGISSRSELNTNDIAAARWKKLESDFQSYVTDLMYAGQIK